MSHIHITQAVITIDQSMHEKGNQSSSSVSVLVSLVSPASPSVSLSLESSESFDFFLGAWPVLIACIWPAIESKGEG